MILLLALLVMHIHTTCMNYPCTVLGEHCAKVMEVQRQISLVDNDLSQIVKMKKVYTIYESESEE